MAQRTRMDTIAGNVANMNTTHDANGNIAPYRKRFVLFSPGQAGNADAPGVRVSKVMQDKSDFRKVLDWSHPDHDAQGYVSYPNIDLAIEMVNAMEASRAYEANVTAMEVTKSMINSSLRLIA